MRPLAALLPLLAALAAAGCGRQPIPPPPEGAVRADATTPDAVDVAGLKEALSAGRVPLLLDVRSRYEYVMGHVPGAVNVPLGELEERLAELQPYRDLPVYVICQVGGRSAEAASLLRRHGLRPVDVQGGTSAWVRAGYETD